MQIAAIVPNFNSAGLVLRCATALLRQRVPAGASVEIIVVDDGSTDGSSDAIGEALGERVRLVRLGTNQGRSSARNAGAAVTAADLLVFIDSDCVPPDDGFFEAHHAAATRGVQLGFGNITTPGPGFWNALQRDAARWRLRALESGELWTYTTQNVSVARQAFHDAGGFDPLFDRYGFEDRDLFLKLAKAGCAVAYLPDAVVIHEDRVALASVSRKLGEAGRHSAWEFADRHPDAYSRMHFGRLDARRRTALLALDRLAWPIARRLGAGPARWLEWNWIPFAVRALAARSIYGAWFLHGTAERRRVQRTEKV